MNISTYKLFKSISEIVDMYSKDLKHHHLHVAVLTYQLAKELGWDKDKVKRASFAAIIHDLGVIDLKEKKELIYLDCINPYPHAILGYQILKRFEPLNEIAEIVKYHHIKWYNGNGSDVIYETIPEESYLIHFADRLDILLDYNREILSQIDDIKKRVGELVGHVFKPDIYDAFLRLCEKESFWLDIYETSLQTFYSWFEMDETQYLMSLEDLAENITKITDYRSRYLNSHSITVGYVSDKIAQLMGLDEKQCEMVKIAGYLHDIGKLVIDNEILEKKDSLSVDEYSVVKKHPYFTLKIIEVFSELKEIGIIAANHHERIDGTGYPFKAKTLDNKSQLVAVADTFTALFEDRAYRSKLNKGDLLGVLFQLAESGKLSKDIVKIASDNFEEIESVCEIIQKNGIDEYNSIVEERYAITQIMANWDLMLDRVEMI